MQKAELLDDLNQAQQRWQALLDQIGEARMDQPGVNGDWSMKDIVAHLTGWNRRLVARILAAQLSEPEPPPLWPAQLHTDDEINAWIYDSNRGRTVHEVMEESREVYQQLRAVINNLPDDMQIEPDYHVIQVGEQRFSASEFFDHFRDDHEPDVRAWLEQVEQEK